MPHQSHQPNLSDVAALAGVSPTTVSRVLNNRGYLSQQTKDKVAQAIEELNYRPNEVARSLLGQRTQMVGVIVPTVALPFFGELVAFLENALTERGYRTLLCNSLGRAENERDYLLQLEGNRVDGIISGAHNDTIAEYTTTRLPVVTVDRDLSPHIPTIRANNLAGGREATSLLLRSGSRHPALFTSRAGDHNKRETGYRQVLKEAGIDPIVVTVMFGTPEPEKTRLIEAALEEWADTIDGVFATDDLTALTIVNWARRKGKRIPEDLRVVGFDGTAAIRTVTPWLSTVRQPIREIAEAAVDRLIGMIEAQPGETENLPLSLELPVTLIEGETT